MNCNCLTYHIRNNHRCSGPCFDHRLRVLLSEAFKYFFVIVYDVRMDLFLLIEP
jgi:hypothetical protein